MFVSERVIVPTRMSLAGIVVGVLAGFVVAQMQPGPTLAAVTSQPPFESGKALDTHIARYNGNYFAVGTEPGISLEPESVTFVRKIGYGETTFVGVLKTASGTYSTDGLSSPYIRYPGIHVEPLQLYFPPLGGQILGWSKLTGWTQIPLFSDSSFGYLEGTGQPNSQEGVCVLDNASGICR